MREGNERSRLEGRAEGLAHLHHWKKNVEDLGKNVSTLCSNRYQNEQVNERLLRGWEPHQQRQLSPEAELHVEIGGGREGLPSAPCRWVTLHQCPGLSEHQCEAFFRCYLTEFS